ncbi:hypothetical protein SCAR479_12645 [Seiridium cardinale]|uniref:Uncharacterized protein n=1 Tax=Seiridium cardinale TaxID=138064 RepID=A0ABR2XAA8_9PEZI
MSSYLVESVPRVTGRPHFGYRSGSRGRDNPDGIQLSTFPASDASLTPHISTFGSTRSLLDNGGSSGYLPLQDERGARGRRGLLTATADIQQRTKHRFRWTRKRGLLRAMRVLFVAGKMATSMVIISSLPYKVKAVVPLNLTMSAVLILWDLIYFIEARWKNSFQLNFEIKTFTECGFFIVVLALMSYELEAFRYTDAKVDSIDDFRVWKGLEATTTLISLTLLGITGLFSYRHVRSFPRNHKLYNKSKPTIVFNANGDPIPVVMDLPLILETTMARRSLDSLLQDPESRSDEGHSR